MYYVILDSHGATLDRFDDRDAALREYGEILREDPLAREDVALVACEDDGTAIERIAADAHVVSA